jgi:uncharacterized Fe-S radical SAM superfamily protein PflX
MKKASKYTKRKLSGLSNRLSIADKLSDSESTEESIERLWSAFDDDLTNTLGDFEIRTPEDLGFISTDLSEATYSTPHEILELNNEFLDEILEECPV